MCLSAFDRRVLDAYLETRQHIATGHAQAICTALGLPLTAHNLARILQSTDRLTRAALALRQEQPTAQPRAPSDAR
jgi:hypothetical protein